MLLPSPRLVRLVRLPSGSPFARGKGRGNFELRINGNGSLVRANQSTMGSSPSTCNVTLKEGHVEVGKHNSKTKYSSHPTDSQYHIQKDTSGVLPTTIFPFQNVHSMSRDSTRRWPNLIISQESARILLFLPASANSGVASLTITDMSAYLLKVVQPLN